MARRCWAFLLCVGLLPCSPTSAEDGSKELAELLSRADVVARGFRGEFETFSGEDQPEAPLDFRTEGLRWKARGRLWVKGDDALVEFLGYPGATPAGSESRYEDIIQVLAASKDGTFDFTAVGPAAMYHATLKTYSPDQPEWVRNRIDSQILDPLKSLSTISGYPIATLVASGDAIVQANPAQGQYSITAQHKDPGHPSTLTYDLTITDQTVRCSSKLTAGPPASVITIETLAEGDIQSGTIIPRRVAKRISAPAWGNLGPGWRDVTREVTHFTPKSFDPAPFPITADYFKKYERSYSVTQGDSKQFGGGLIRLKRLTVLALVGLLTAAVVASGLVLWLRSRGSRSSAKKPERPFPELL